MCFCRKRTDFACSRRTRIRSSSSFWKIDSLFIQLNLTFTTTYFIAYSFIHSTKLTVTSIFSCVRVDNFELLRQTSEPKSGAYLRNEFPLTMKKVERSLSFLCDVLSKPCLSKLMMAFFSQTNLRFGRSFLDVCVYLSTKGKTMGFHGAELKL